MSKKFIPSFKLAFFLAFLLFGCFLIFKPLTSYSANPEKSTELSIEDLRLKPITSIKGRVGDLLLKWYAEGSAAGNAGDYYDNRDRGHSHLRMEDYPQLQKIKYSQEQKIQKKDWAAQLALLPHVVLGNSSTSADILDGGSNVRTYYSNSGGTAFLYKQYRHNNLYIYPAHHDYRSRTGGDIFPINSPYLIASKGSSGSDRKYMNAVAQTLAAFRPDVKTKLIDTGLLMPTMQMIFRYAAAGNRQNYLKGTNHRVAGIQVNNLKMVEIAHNLKIDEIPPLVQLKVLEEDKPFNGEDFFSPEHSINLADTPCVIARIFRGTSYWHRMVVSAEQSFALNDGDLSYHWKVLQGNPEKISIRPLNTSGSRVEIKIAYHEKQPISQNEDMESSRVDIGVFVKSGKYYSAPGFITSFSLDNEARTYYEEGKILEIGYGMGNAVIEIIDWSAFFKMLNPKNDSRKATILKNQFTRNEIKFMNSLTEDYSKIDTAIEELEKELHSKQGKEKRVLQKKLIAQKKTEREFITQKQGGREDSINQLTRRKLNSFIENPGFLNAHNSDIKRFLHTASLENKSAFLQELNRLENYGIIKTNKDLTITITPIRKGSGPVQRLLTKFEYALIKNLNATVISSLFFPDVISNIFEVNFVDQRLITPKFWRDVYQYNNAGQPAGWVRYNEDGKTEFNKDGLMVLAKDSLGRCIKSRKVEYTQEKTERDKKGRLPYANTYPLQQAPANEIWHYEYKDDSDWRGKVVRIEKIN